MAWNSGDGRSSEILSEIAAQLLQMIKLTWFKVKQNATGRTLLKTSSITSEGGKDDKKY